MAGNMENVITMSAGTMAREIAGAKHDVLLVYYYAEWCNMCKIFSEKYAAAAAILAKAGYDGVLSRVLAEQQSLDQGVDRWAAACGTRSSGALSRARIE